MITPGLVPILLAQHVMKTGQTIQGGLDLTEASDYNPWEHMKWELDLDSFEFIISAFEEYNRESSSGWLWPEDIEKISMSMKSEGDLTSVQKSEWIDFAKSICESDSISISENTFTIIGKHGSKFTFDASLEFSRWLPPNSLSSHEIGLSNIKRGVRNKHILGDYMANLEASSASWKIETGSEYDGLGFQSFPEHMSNLELKEYEAYSTHIFPSGDTFIESISLMINHLIEDEEIWNILHQQEVDRRKFNEEYDRKWPNGRPDDWMYL